MGISIARLSLSERDVEDWFFENPRACRYGEYWQIERWIGRQYKLPSGIADLVGVTSQGCLAVLEVKNVPADGRAIAQVCRYAHDLQEVLYYRWDYECRDANGPVVQKIIAAPSMESVNVYFEADACKVTLLEFQVSLQVNVHSAYPETEHDLDRYHEKTVSIHEIAKSQEWDVFGPYSLPSEHFRRVMAQHHQREMLSDGGDAEHF